MNPLLIGLLGKVFDTVSNYFDPTKKAEAQLELLKLQQASEFKEIDTQLAMVTAQTDINKVEAASPSLFVSGGRPFVIWICGFSLAYVGIAEPILRFIAQVGFHYTGSFPVIDTSLTLQILGGLLGLGTLRSYDKKNGVASQ